MPSFLRWPERAQMLRDYIDNHESTRALAARYHRDKEEICDMLREAGVLRSRGSGNAARLGAGFAKRSSAAIRSLAAALVLAERQLRRAPRLDEIERIMAEIRAYSGGHTATPKKREEMIA